jgi:hypothetical protein
MPRTLTTTFRNNLEASANPDIPVLFATITNPLLADPIRVVNDVVDYQWQGELYIGFPFMIELVTDSDRPPSAKIRMQNVNGVIGRMVQRLKTTSRIRLDVIASSEFADPVANLRIEIGTPTVEYTADMLRLRNVNGDAMMVEGELWSFDMSREPYPAIRTTKNRLPGLYR